MRGEQLARQWRLIQRLAKSHAGLGVDDLAAELECTRRTVYRDLEALMSAGFPVTSEKRDNRVYYHLIRGYRLGGDVPFTSDELLALAFGQDLLQSLEGTVFHDSIRSALAKIRASLGPDLAAFATQLGDAFRAVPGPHKKYAELGDGIRVLKQAVLDHRTIEMSYRTGRTGRRSRRALDPYRVWYRNGGLYVIGHDHESGEIRTFAVDRIDSPKLTPARFRIRDDFDFEARTASAFGVVADPPDEVRIRFEPRWALYVEEHTWHPSQKSSRAKDGSVELAMNVGVGEEVRNWILSFGAGAEVLAPESLRREVAAELAKARKRYG